MKRKVAITVLGGKPCFKACTQGQSLKPPNWDFFHHEDVDSLGDHSDRGYDTAVLLVDYSALAHRLEDILRKSKKMGCVTILMTTGIVPPEHLKIFKEACPCDQCKVIYYPFSIKDLISEVEDCLYNYEIHEGIFWRDITIAENRVMHDTTGVLKVRLSQKEYMILKTFMGAELALATRQDLASALGGKWEYGDRKVDVHVGKLRKKLDYISSGALAIKSLRSIGYQVMPVRSRQT